MEQNKKLDEPNESIDKMIDELKKSTEKLKKTTKQFNREYKESVGENRVMSKEDIKEWLHRGGGFAERAERMGNNIKDIECSANRIGRISIALSIVAIIIAVLSIALSILFQF